MQAQRSALLLAPAAGFLLGGLGLSQRWNTASADAPATSGALNPKEFTAFKVAGKEQLTHDTYRVRFELPDNKTSGLHVASCLVTRAVIQEKAGDKPKAVIRPYTPVSSKDAAGYLDLVVKVYGAGAMSRHIGSLDVGDKLEMKGPIPKLPIKPNDKKHIVMLAGGTGITPMIQVIEELLSDPADTTNLYLMYANHTTEDIILKERIDRLASRYPRLKVYYIVGHGKWTGSLDKLQPNVARGVGRINADLIKSFAPGPKTDSVQVLVCGPPGFMDAISGNKAKDYTQGELSGALRDLRYTKDQVFKF